MTAQKLVRFVFIALFVAMTTFVGFFHTEKSPKPSPSCPACQLQASSLAVHEIDCPGNLQLHFFDNVVAFEHFDYKRLVSPDLSTRSPPRG